MKKLIFSGLLGGGVMLLLALNLYKPASPAKELNAAVKNLKEINEVDRARNLTRRKVLQIIHEFNPAMEASLKEQIADEIIETSLKYPNLDVNLICATITHESNWAADAVSKAGAMGLMQIMPTTGRWLAKYEGINWTSDKEILFNPIYNVRLGSRYLSALIENYELEGGLAAYNGGAKRVELWLSKNKANGILWDETSNYIPFVMRWYDKYKDSEDSAM
jgi:soluble lytic murein transglycosylase